MTSADSTSIARRILHLVFPFILTVVSSCGGGSTTPDEGYVVIPADSPQPAGDRLLGLGITESEEGFQSSFNVALETGLQATEILIHWDSVEVAQGVYQDPMGGVLQAITFFGYYDVDVMLNLAVVNTVRTTVPEYLSGSGWDSQEMIDAFNDMMDWVMARVPSNVDIISISIGNEVDLYLQDDEWDPYCGFVEATSDHIRSTYPGVTIGVKSTVTNGVFGSDLFRVQQLNQHTDAVMLTYYPQDGSFQVLDPQEVHSHLQLIEDAFPGREIWMNEVGYQSGSQYCASSQTMQARFYHEFFSAWDDHRDTFRLALIIWLHDISDQQLEELEEYYGISAPGFLEYLATLGLRNIDDTDKYAWPQLLEETGARGW
ncbi:MAG: hypothetical protein JXA64_12130 [Candidatus Fermentibacteraceae bacterium]|nr:hypothetical protein [Candidatus Fermentibacteraceae bacterium]MBN2609847.1 hypothetical protein [Candidatus Fermentibacteraceae bacterium]